MSIILLSDIQGDILMYRDINIYDLNVAIFIILCIFKLIADCGLPTVDCRLILKWDVQS